MPIELEAPPPAPPQRTFRDPAGSVEVRSDAAYRVVRPAYAADMLALLAEPWLQPLVASGRLIASEVQSPTSCPASDLASDPNASLLLRHPRVPFPSYPWEWSPALWLAASDLTLDLCRDLLTHGWTLKDATPLNVLFQGIQPVFVDVLSLQRIDLTQPIWFAYGQFVRTFLLPMLAHTRLGWPLQVALTRRDGFEPEEIYAALPWTQRLQQPARGTITLPLLFAKATGRAFKAASPSQSSSAQSSPSQSSPALVQHILRKTVATLRTRMHQAAPAQRSSVWSEYVHTAAHYTPEDHTLKQAFVQQALQHAAPTHVLDVGCNTGVYSRLAARTGASVVAIDTDMQAVDRLATTLQATTLQATTLQAGSAPTDRNILPLCVDLAHPTPGTGWQNRESLSFLARATGHFDTVLMLAVLHHLLLQGQVPLEQIAQLCSTLTTRTLIVEWVPPTDSMFQQLLRGREALYRHLTEQAFRQAFASSFDLQRELTLPNRRILFHFTRRQPAA